MQSEFSVRVPFFFLKDYLNERARRGQTAQCSVYEKCGSISKPLLFEARGPYGPYISNSLRSLTVCTTTLKTLSHVSRASYFFLFIFSEKSQEFYLKVKRSMFQDNIAFVTDPGTSCPQINLSLISLRIYYSVLFYSAVSR